MAANGNDRTRLPDAAMKPSRLFGEKKTPPNSGASERPPRKRGCVAISGSYSGSHLVPEPPPAGRSIHTVSRP
eukprot:3263636-Prymnesium_polylepis.1